MAWIFVFSPRKLVSISTAVFLIVHVLGRVLPLMLANQASLALPKVIVSIAGFGAGDEAGAAAAIGP